VTTVKRATFREAASVIASPESGIVSVRGTARQHERVQEFIDQVMSSAKRQVMIEATIAEVELGRDFQQGVDWSRVASTASSNGLFFAQTGAAITTSVTGSPAGLLTLTSRGGGGDSGTFTSAIRLLEAFGTVKVLSSPKISVINNQSAILKVVDNQVYFNIKAESTTTNNSVVTNFTTEQRVVPVGFVMNVTPQISGLNEVLLNVRPSITRIQRFEDDPNPALTSTNPVTGVTTRIPNRVPVIRTREMESVLRIQNGSIAVMGGLMEEKTTDISSAVPWFHTIPGIGALFSQKSSEARKTELVIFLRPTVIHEAGINGDFSRLREHLPNKEFFSNNPGPKYQLLPSDTGPGEDKK
jgi:general secretion pathway protein D